ncbi:hypothetical protein [Bythopirellula polymerisocia]|uniref:Uncharacterized protein n=1 Tax=Bythopirellula polymerisocia TaxID=2528003 RepID=A0A5C6D0H2_9BACT|nr:hypothetical protein [Bythopirellula polymerisocia]TWU30218.1 hypothetical protein Pla144_10040 [Bythopirellula polymerisocia]
MDDTQINDSDKRALRTMLFVGCDREMAAKVLGWTAEKLRKALESDTEFANELLQAEGQAEFHHMRVLHNAAKDEKHWRVAAWWLERRAKRRYGRRSQRDLTDTQLEDFIENLARIIQSEVTQDEDRQRLLEKMAEFLRGESQEITEPSP